MLFISKKYCISLKCSIFSTQLCYLIKRIDENFLKRLEHQTLEISNFANHSFVLDAVFDERIPHWVLFQCERITDENFQGLCSGQGDIETLE